jgi:hypothetical protein
MGAWPVAEIAAKHLTGALGDYGPGRWGQVPGSANSPFYPARDLDPADSGDDGDD